MATFGIRDINFKTPYSSYLAQRTTLTKGLC
jgi:hypothetical protein